jgi:hypothetical protein
MDSIRSQVDAEVERFAEAARAMTDWRTYVPKLPWICLGVGAAIGYFLVRPKQQPPVTALTLEASPAPPPQAVTAPSPPAPQPESLAFTLVRVAAPFVLKLGLMALEQRMLSSGNHAGPQSADGSQPTPNPQRSPKPQ